MSQLRPYPTAEAPEIYWYQNDRGEAVWGTEMRDMLYDGVSLDGDGTYYVRIDTFTNYIKLPPDYYTNFMRVMQANHSEMVC